MTKRDELAVIITARNSTCDECKEELASGAWIRTLEDRRALCLSCADLDHLEYLPAGNTALTRRSKKYSSLWAVVLKWSQSRKRYERQGLLVEKAALVRAEQECLNDAEARARQRNRAAELRVVADKKFIEAFTAKVRQLYPACPEGRDSEIALHACEKYSGRVGRSASAKSLEVFAIQLAVQAHIRHSETNYDELLASGIERTTARQEVRARVDFILNKWAGGEQ